MFLVAVDAHPRRTHTTAREEVSPRAVVGAAFAASAASRQVVSVYQTGLYDVAYWPRFGVTIRQNQRPSAGAGTS